METSSRRRNVAVLTDGPSSVDRNRSAIEKEAQQETETALIKRKSRCCC
jgi:hypothetical protein